MRLVPRWYQEETCTSVMQALIQADNTHPIAAVVTGGGKSLIAAMLAEAIIQRWPTRRVLALAPSMELVSQNTAEARSYLSPALASRVGVYCAGLNQKQRTEQLTFATPQSFVNQVRHFAAFDVVIVDEAHTFDLTTKTARKIVETLKEKNPKVRFVALTATPLRMQGLRVVPLSQCGLFDSKVYDLTSGRNFNRLVREGYISRVVAPPVRFPQVDTSKVKTKGGDFDEAQLAIEAMRVTEACVDVALAEASERKHFMWFAVNIQHARMIHEALAARGESVVTIHGELEKGERVEGIAAYLKKEHRHIVSVAMLTTGFNARFVDCLVVLRPTRSLVLWLQIIGRGFRPYDGKADCLVLDAGGNFARHGAVNEDRDNGDSRSGMWACSDQVVINPHAPKLPDGTTVAPRERSAIRFPMHSVPAETDLRVILGLMGDAQEPCGYWNDAEHLTCRQCGRARQGYLAMVQKRTPRDRGILGDDDSYELHDEADVVLEDIACTQTMVATVDTMTLTPTGNSQLRIDYSTEVGPCKLRLDFDRTAQDGAYYAYTRKFFELATGRKLPGEPHRALLMRDLIDKPIDITLTKYQDNSVYLTNVRFIRDGQVREFRYDPAFHG
jgi:superfamily II DNA or RNA helicase